jgi:glycosyltransferase involved in cell wall biosynthesis
MREEADVACACYGEDCDRQTSGFCALSGKVFKHLEKAEDEIQMLQEMSEAGCTFEYVQLHNSAPAEEELLQKYKIGVVVPAYNEENLIKTTIEGIPDYVDRIYVINDCSSDNTAQVLEDIEDPRVFAITHEVNKGAGAAIITGYKRALKEDMDIVVTMDGDNQMNPEYLPKLLLPIIEGKADYSKGNRLFSSEFRGGMSKWRKLGNGLLTMITKIGSGYWHIMDPQNGYTAISKRALSEVGIDNIYTYYGYCNHMLIRLNAFGFRTVDVKMPSRYGDEKSTIKYGPYMVKVSLMLFRNFLWRLKFKYMILNFHPLVLFYILSMIMIPGGVLFGLYILVKKIMSLPVSTNYPLLDALIIITGLQFLFFAMLFDMQESERDMRNDDIRSNSIYE